MTSNAIRQSFLDFFQGKKHTIVPSASLMPDSPNLLFTNAGMNQFVPIFLGTGACPFDPARAADTQKCIRAGGKHNDLDDVGFDTYHHTFFEMLGNWSFGDYFKAEAIGWAWELLVERWGFPPARLYATVYRPGGGDPGEFDAEAHDCWSELFSAAGLDPARHVVDGGKQDNFWMMGETGPCGPCSELHIDLTADGDSEGRLVNAGDARCIEIWNLVFIQFNANPDGTFSDLAARHVDTGMGFERVVSVVQGTRGFSDFSSGLVSNYETDVFRPLFDEIGVLSGHQYGSSLPVAGQHIRPGSKEANDIAFRVIADHIRTLSFAIADGILPGNSDRRYVLRRILRRAVRYGRTLGLHKPFFYGLADVVARTMGDVFPELRERLPIVRETLHAEEEAFNRTLDKGISLFEAEAAPLGHGATVPGALAFRLYDEQGFPLDLTQLMARERGMSVDEAGFEALMHKQREAARAARKTQVIEVSEIATSEPTHFEGFDATECDARIVEVVRAGGRNAAVLDQTPFYAEMGGQVGDTGLIAHGTTTWRVVDTRKHGGVILHFLEGDDVPEAGLSVSAIVDPDHRAAIERHHTATHLLHWAIHEVASRDATQKGSSVTPAKLTFDFNSNPLTAAEVRDMERLVNERIMENADVSATEVPYEAVRERSDIMQFFGDKYGDTVRVVQIGGVPGAMDGYSMELCGGTHVRATGGIGCFRILSEQAVAAGVRRIEAVAGTEALHVATSDAARLAAIASSLHCPPTEIEKKLHASLEHARGLEKALHAAMTREASRTADDLIGRAEELNGRMVILAEVEGADGDSLQMAADALKRRFQGVVFLAGSPAPDLVAFVSGVPPALAKTVPAGKLLAAAASAAGGKGGGRAEAARGAGRDPSRIPAAMEAAREFLATCPSLTS
jgi:alanyl-tRNA synthetase